MKMWMKLAFSSMALVAVMGNISWAEGTTQHPGSGLEHGHGLNPSSMEAALFDKPGPEQAWLNHFVGEWRTENEMSMMPGQPPVKTTGSESVTTVGDFWIIAEHEGTMMDRPFEGVLTLGYDNNQKQYVGTWVDNMKGKMWQYEGTLDKDGKTLTLRSEGACPLRPGKISQFKEVIEIHDNNHRTFTSYVMDDEGQWMKMMTSHSFRKQ